MAKVKSISEKRAAPRVSDPAATVDVARAKPQPHLREQASKHFPIVGIGASAGGLGAFEAFLSAMPFKTEKGLALVLVQHLSPHHKSLLSELVQRYTRMRVHEVADGMEVKPNRVYIIPPNCQMALMAGKLHLFPPTKDRGSILSIDFFFRSLAAEQHECAIGVILSGTGSDGTAGIRAVKAEGGMAMAQSPESTEFDGMPRSAIATGLVDYVLAPAEMPARLIAYANKVLPKMATGTSTAPASTADALAKICVLLRHATGHDFSQYKGNTILRRVHRRMALHQIEKAEDYLRYMQSKAEETEALFRDLLIGVTSFFRDSDAFDAMRTTGIPRLFDGVPPGGAIRVWVCGCSTGEEAYSLAILIQEHIETLSQVFKVQIFATDIDCLATDQARKGIFPASISADVPPDLMSRYFKKNLDGCYQIKKVIRDTLIFSEQDVLKDPPFSKVGLISCRNLLIYLKGELQSRIISLFHYALKPGGLLFLGNSETVGEQGERFEILNRRSKLYLRKEDEPAAVRLTLGEMLGQNRDMPPDAVTSSDSSEIKPNLRELTEHALLKHADLSCVLVREDGEILYFHGRTGNYLEPSQGDAACNVLAMAREGLRGGLINALAKACLQKEAARAMGLQVKVNGHHITVDVTVIAASLLLSPRLYLIIFQERSAAGQLLSEGRSAQLAELPEGTARGSALELELRTKDEYIQNLIEEMETSGEELKSSNEEMQSVNEELQSTNEELETSKEELQSVNEELATVNAELQQKVADLSRANNDMNNLLAGTGVGTLFVDHQLNIARYTPAITKLINLIPTDIGRPLAHTVSSLVDYERVISGVQKVLDTLIPIEEEAQTKTGSWYLLGVRPYRTLDNIIEGAVITFVDITARKVAEQKLNEAERFRVAAEMESVGIVIFTLDGGIVSANDAFLRMSGYDRTHVAAGHLHWGAIVETGERDQFEADLNELRDCGYIGKRQQRYIHTNGSHRSAMFTAKRTGENEAAGYLIDFPESPSEKTSSSAGTA